MATNRKRTPRSRRETDLNQAQIDWLNSVPWRDGGGITYFIAYYGCGNWGKGECGKALWDQHKAGILEEWVEGHPCTRPERWWEFDAPGETASWYPRGDCHGAQPYRRRIGGSGAPSYAARTTLGIPSQWTGGIPLDPPTFESQAAYLERHGLLTAEERRHLKRHPELLEPQAVAAKQ